MRFGRNSLAAIAIAATLATGAAQASTLHFNYSENGGIDFSFKQSSNPTPISYGPGFATEAPVSDWTGNIGPYSSIAWFNSKANGMFDTIDGSYIVFGPQVYSGPESAPVFAPGVFAGADQTNGLSGTLTVTSVPEASTWAMMLLGFAGLGFAGYRTSRKAASA
jgi:hypothetical protein